jgi:hypothetical protein
MAFSLITSASALATGAGSITTSSIDTTGANLIVVSLSGYLSVGNLTDSKSNTWTALTAQTNVVSVRLFYCYSPTVGSGHTFTQSANTYGCIGVLAFSGADASPFDVENGATSSTSPLSTGSVTPSDNGSLLVTGLCGVNNGTYSVTESFTSLFAANYSAGSNMGGACGYKVQATAAAINPAWSFSPSASTAVAIAAFTPAAGGGGSQGAAMHYYRQCQRHEQPKLILPDRELITELPRFNRIENRLAT